MKPVQSAVKNVAKKSTGTRPFQSTSNTITESGEECETTEQPSCSHRGGPRNVHEETFKIQIDDEWEILLECHNRRPGRPRKVIEETPNFQNDDERKILLECHNRPRGRPRKVLEETSNTGKEHGKQQQSQNCRRGRSKKFLEEMSSDVTNDVEEEQSEPDSDMMVVEEETDKEHETRSRSQHCCRGRSRKFLEGTSSRKEDQETLLQSQHCHVGLSRKVLEGLFNEMTLENNTSVPVSPRKCVAKKSTGTRAIQSKSQQQEKFQDKKKKTASLPVTEPQNEQNESDVDMVASDAEEESSHRNRKYPVRSRKKTQEKRVYDEESDEESPDRNRKKSARSPRKTQKNHVDSDQDYEEADEESPDRNRKKSARSPRKTRKNHADSDQDYEEADEEGPSTSQIRSRNIGETDIETLVHKCVYYLLIADQKKHAIKKTDIMKHVIKGPQQLYSDVIDGANEVLKKTYGMEITQLRKGNLMLINNLTQELDVQQYSCLSGVKKQQQGLILYLLLIIYMNENSISESDLWNALVPLGIKPSTQKSHPIFGDVQKYINSELVKQMYIDHVCISKDPLHYEYRWGPRAESEVDKSDLLQFACLVLDKKPEDWILQYKDATESAETQDSVENS